jgi:hypothetical protein
MSSHELIAGRWPIDINFERSLLLYLPKDAGKFQARSILTLNEPFIKSSPAARSTERSFSQKRDIIY